MNIVVGLDTTPAATEALRWAARYAGAVGADLHAVHAYLWSEQEAVLLPTGLTVFDRSGAHPRAVEPPEDVSRLFASVQPESSWTLQCFSSDPGPLLRRQSENADLLASNRLHHAGGTTKDLISASRPTVWRRLPRESVAPQFPAAGDASN